MSALPFAGSGRGSAAAARLETSYRRLLALYPADHRRQHGEEMLGVLLDMAATGQRRPHPRDVLDLLLGAVRLHVRRMMGMFAGPWREALAVAGVIALVGQAVFSVTGNLTQLVATATSRFGIVGYCTSVGGGHCPGQLKLGLAPLVAVAAAAAALSRRRVLTPCLAWPYVVLVAFGMDRTMSPDKSAFTPMTVPYTAYHIGLYGGLVASTCIAFMATFAAPSALAIPKRTALRWGGTLTALVIFYWFGTANNQALVEPDYFHTSQIGCNYLGSDWLPSVLLVAAFATAVGRSAHSPLGRRAAVVLVLPALGLLKSFTGLEAVPYDDWIPDSWSGAIVANQDLVLPSLLTAAALIGLCSGALRRSRRDPNTRRLPWSSDSA